MMTHGGFDANKWDCPCGGVSDVYELKNEAGQVVYHIMECKTCGKWRRHVPELGDQEIGTELPEELKEALDKRGERIRAAPDPLAHADAFLAAPEPMPAPPWEGGPKDSLPPEMALPGSGPKVPPEELAIALESMPPIPEDPSRMVQGTIIACSYCRDVYPDLGADCPLCHGGGPRFRPARMMDRFTSNDELLRDLFWLFELEGKMREDEKNRPPELFEQYRSSVINMIEKIGLYNFDIKEALVQRVHDMDQDFEIDPKKGP